MAEPDFLPRIVHRHTLSAEAVADSDPKRVLSDVDPRNVLSRGDHRRDREPGCRRGPFASDLRMHEIVLGALPMCLAGTHHWRNDMSGYPTSSRSRCGLNSSRKTRFENYASCRSSLGTVGRYVLRTRRGGLALVPRPFITCAMVVAYSRRRARSAICLEQRFQALTIGYNPRTPMSFGLAWQEHSGRSLFRSRRFDVGFDGSGNDHAFLNDGLRPFPSRPSARQHVIASEAGRLGA